MVGVILEERRVLKKKKKTKIDDLTDKQWFGGLVALRCGHIFTHTKRVDLHTDSRKRRATVFSPPPL